MSRELTQRTDFYDVWHKFITSGDTEGVPENVRESWRRCRDRGLDPVKEPAGFQIDQRSVDRLIDANLDIHHLLQRHYKEIEGQFDFAPFVILFTDAEGYVLSIQGDDTILRTLEKFSVKEGLSLRECDMGTTAPGISLVEGRPATVLAEEHYHQGFHWASCFSIPISDHKKNILGCLDFTSTLHFGKRLEHLIPYFCNIAHSLQFEVFLKRKLELLELHDSYFRSTFEYADKVLILVNRRGQIVDLNASAQRSLGLNVDKSLRRNVEELLDLSQALAFSSHRKGTQIVRLHTTNSVNSTPFSMETIPILSKSGDEIAYLLRLEREKVTVTLSGRASNAARFSFENIVGHSPRILDVIDRAGRVAKTFSNVLLEGETGTGKELVARTIHYTAHRKNNPFVKVDCTALTGTLLDNVLFGHVVSSADGTLSKKKGKLEEAVARLRQARSAKPALVDAHNNLGLAFARQNDVDEAAASFQRALKLEPGRPLWELRLATLDGIIPLFTGQKNASPL